MRAKSLLLLVIAINVLFFWGQLAITNTNAETTFYTVGQGDLLSRAGSAENLTINNFEEGDLPSSASSVDTDSGNFFTDAFNSIKNWFLDLAGVNFVLGIVNAVPNFLIALGLPEAISFGLGAIWYLISIFTVVAFMWGRE